VRELENTLERALALMEGNTIEVTDLGLPSSRSVNVATAATTLQDKLDQVEHQMIMDALKAAHNNRTAAARLLGVTFRSLRYRMARLGMNE
jgi:two-component system response regulator PilR (NtrC family)